MKDSLCRDVVALLQEDLVEIIGEDPTKGIFRLVISNSIEKKILPKSTISEKELANLNVKKFIAKQKFLSVFDVGMRFLCEFQKVLIRITGLSTGKMYFYKAGVSIARSYFYEAGINIGMKESGALEKLPERIKAKFKCKVRFKTKKKEKYLIIIGGSAFARKYGPSDSPVCDLIRGYIRGVLGLSYVCREVMCRACDDPNCMFEFFRPKSSAELLSRFI